MAVPMARDRIVSIGSELRALSALVDEIVRHLLESRVEDDVLISG